MTGLDLTILIPQNDVVDASFDGSGIPAGCQAQRDGVEVLFQAFGKGGDAGQAGGAGTSDPLREVLAGELGDHDGERPDLLACGAELGAAFQDGLEPGPLVVGERARAAGDPACDLPDGRRGRWQRRPGGAVLGKVVADDGVAAVVAERGDLLEEPGDAAAADVGVLVQVGLERVELARARLLPAAVGEFLPGRGAGVALDGVQSPAQVAGDLPQAAALGEQAMDGRVVSAGAVGVLARRIRPRGGRRPRRRGLRGGGRRGIWFVEAGAVRGGAPFDGLGEVLPQVEPVGDLDRLWCPGAGPVGVGAGAVAADHLNPGMGGQPARQRLSVAAFEQVQRCAGLAVDDDRAVILAAPDGEVIQLSGVRTKFCRVFAGRDVHDGVRSVVRRC